MEWQKKEIVKKVFSFALSVLLVLYALGMIIGFINYNDGAVGKGIIIFVIMLGFFSLIAWTNCKGLIEAVQEYKVNQNSNLTDELKLLNPYNSQKEMQAAFDIEKQNPLFEDDDFVITKSFLASPTKISLFIVNGILDVKTLVHKVNGIIDSVTLSVLYYDGKKYEFKFDRPFGFSNMQEKANKIELVANIVASNSENFRKYPTCRL